jgi:hypothetical protein
MESKIEFKVGANQIIVPKEQKEKLEQMNEEVQMKYKLAKKYKPFPNSPEEKIAEQYVFERLVESLPNWSIKPTFLDVGKFDIELSYKLKPAIITIEIKTKKESPTDYIWKHTHPECVDRTAGVPKDKIGQILEADYTVWAMSSPFSVFTKYADSSTEIVGATKKEKTTIDNFRNMPATEKTTEHYIIEVDKNRSQFEYNGLNAINEVIQDIKKRYENPR